MRKLLQLFFRLPPEARLLVVMLAILAPLLALGLVMPAALIGWLTGGVLIMFAALFGVVLTHRLRTRLQGQRLDREISGQLSGPSRRELAEKDREFRQKWLTGIEKLKKARISLYDLPWYILIGEPGGGKTMTLLNSGMDFPMGKDELPGFGGTRNYNWWFTNTAVILDTAGRLVFEQEGTSDRHEWESFLKLLKRRRRCPINGVVVALPADKLMSDGAEQRERAASVIRDRLRQIQTVLGVRFPEFLLVTKSDLVAGFTEFFNDLDSLQRNQLFGWSRAGDFDAPYDPREFGEEFEALYRRLHELRLSFLGRKASDVELGWIHTYPDGFRSLKERIQDYVDVIFSRNIFAEPLFFRGFYFTSALQEGRPFLELLGQHLTDEKLENLEGLFPQSRAFFIHDFYTRKVAREQGMIFRSQKHINRTRLMKRSTLMVGVPLFILLSFLTILGYLAYSHTVSNPVATVRQAAELAAKYKAPPEDAGSGPRPADAGDAARAVEMSAALDQAVQAFREPSGLAMLMFGSIAGSAESYIRQVQRELIGYCLVRPEVARVEQALSSPALALTPQNLADFQASLQTYLSWHFGRESGTLDGLRRILPPDSSGGSTSNQALERFTAVSRGRLAAGLAGERAQRRRVIDAALEKARNYWMSSTDVQQHPDYAWWRRLLERCAEVRTCYRDLLAGYRGFDQAASRKEFLEAVAGWLRGFPQLEGAASAPATGNTLLLQPLREHLRAAPRGEAGGAITQPGELMEANARKAAAFWRDCLAALPRPDESVPDEVSAEAASLREQMQSQEQAVAREFEVRRGALDAQLREMESVIVPRPPRAPQQYDFVEAALTAQRVLSEQVASALQDVDADLPASIERWAEQVERLADEPAPDTHFELDPEWDPPGLRRLAESAARARHRFESQLLVEGIASHLAQRSPQGLARFVDGYDDDSHAKALRFAGLKNRHAESFLRLTLASRKKLEASLAEATKRGLVRDDADVRRLLAESTRDYVEDYVTAWSDAYGRQRLEAVERFSFDRPASWEEYRGWIRRNGSELQRGYRDHLDALFEHAIEPFAPGSETAGLLAGVDWPGDSKLEPLVGQLGSGRGLPDAVRPVQAWDRFEDGIEAGRVAGIQDLTRERIEFPQLGRDESGQPLLEAEWLTRQMQFVIDYGRWLLEADVRKLILARLEPFASRKPFVFEGGQYETVDLPALRGLLDDFGRIRGFLQGPASPSAPPEAGRSADLIPWLDRAEAWRKFLAKELCTLEVGYEPPAPGSGKSGPAEFYTTVVLSLPGISGADGTPQDELSFDSANPAAPRQVRWRPVPGGVVVALYKLNPSVQARDAAIQPRVLELPRAEYPLLCLLQRHGTRGPDGWRMELSTDMRQIQGLAALDVNPGVRWLTLTVRFVDPEGGPPDPLAWPEAGTTGPRPETPWRSE
jgi:hypothetical protein